MRYQGCQQRCIAVSLSSDEVLGWVAPSACENWRTDYTLKRPAASFGSCVDYTTNGDGRFQQHVYFDQHISTLTKRPALESAGSLLLLLARFAAERHAQRRAAKRGSCAHSRRIHHLDATSSTRTHRLNPHPFSRARALSCTINTHDEGYRLHQSCRLDIVDLQKLQLARVARAARHNRAELARKRLQQTPLILQSFRHGLTAVRSCCSADVGFLREVSDRTWQFDRERTRNDSTKQVRPASQ